MLSPGLAIHNIWGADQVPAVPDEGLMPAHVSYFPPVNGYRFGLITIPPESSTPAPSVDPQVGAAEMERKLPGLASHFEPDHPRMHLRRSVARAGRRPAGAAEIGRHRRPKWDATRVAQSVHGAVPNGLLPDRCQAPRGGSLSKTSLIAILKVA